MAEAKLTGFLSVEQAFGGTQYLELLNKVSIYDLAAEIQKDNPTYSITSKDRKSTRLNSSHIPLSRMPSSA